MIHVHVDSIISHLIKIWMLFIGDIVTVPTSALTFIICLLSQILDKMHKINYCRNIKKILLGKLH